MPHRLPARSLLALLPLVAALVGVGGNPASAATGTPPATAIRYALAQLGEAYVYGGTGPSTWDCSGLVQASYGAAGVTLPRVSRDQYSAGTHVARSSWAPGDLVFWATDPAVPSTIYHVAIYLGNGMVLQAPKTGDVVRVATLWTSGLVPYATRPAASSAAMLASALQAGATGDAVRDTQTRLRANGYPVAVTGVFDPATVTATRRFQGSVGMLDNGIVGQITWGQLVARGVRDRVS